MNQVTAHDKVSCLYSTIGRNSKRIVPFLYGDGLFKKRTGHLLKNKITEGKGMDRRGLFHTEIFSRLKFK